MLIVGGEIWEDSIEFFVNKLLGLFLADHAIFVSVEIIPNSIDSLLDGTVDESLLD